MQALEIFGALARTVEAGDYPLWANIMGGWITTLYELERYEDAYRIGVKSAADAERVGLLGMKHFVDAPLGLVEEKLGRHEEARVRLDKVIAEREAYGFEGAFGLEGLLPPVPGWPMLRVRRPAERVPVARGGSCRAAWSAGSFCLTPAGAVSPDPRRRLR